MLRQLFPCVGRAYPDAQLAFVARITIAEDLMLADVTQVSITSAHGVIHLKGSVRHGCDKGRIEGDIRAALQRAGLPYARFVNALQVRAGGSLDSTRG